MSGQSFRGILVRLPVKYHSTQFFKTPGLNFWCFFGRRPLEIFGWSAIQTTGKICGRDKSSGGDPSIFSVKNQNNSCGNNWML